MQNKLEAGATCIVSGELILPEGNRNEHAFNYKQYLFRQNIHWLFRTSELPLSQCHISNQSIIHTLYNIRAELIHVIDDSFPKILTPYAKALIFGDRTSFSDESYRTYQEIGVVHLLAISGLHIGLLVTMLYFLLLRMGVTKETIYWMLVLLLPVYAILSGGNPPVIRAVITTIILLSAQKWRLPLTTLDSFSLSFILFLFFNPYLIYHIGFQLSYSVSFSIITSTHVLTRNRNSYLKNMFDISIISMLSSVPILTYHFYEFSTVSVIANLIFIPFYSVFVLPSIFFLFIVQFIHSSLFTYVAIPLEKLLVFSETVAMWLSSVKYSMIITGKPSSAILLFMILSTFIYMLLVEKNKPRTLAILPFMLVLSLQLLTTTYSLKGEVVFIDVGQGDSTLIKLPFNQGTYLIDTGGQLQFPVEKWQVRRSPFRVGEKILIPFLKSKGIRGIDKLILTHSDVDHMGAAGELLDEMTVKEIYISPNSWEKPLMREVVSIANKYKVPIFEKKAGINWQTGSGEFHIIYPFSEIYEGNNSSLVLFANFGGLNWIFMGDVEKEGEHEIIRVYPMLDADIIKIGHHGSKSSTTRDFIQLISPRFAAISAGKNNRYGHPNADVLDVLSEFDIKIWRTDGQGSIHYLFTKNKGTFRTILQYDESNTK